MIDLNLQPLIQYVSFAYSVEYLIPYHSKVENDSLPGWEPSNIVGYAYSITSQLEYLLTDTTALILQANGGKQYWEGSDWEQVNDTLVKWPENETIFWGTSASFRKYF